MMYQLTTKYGCGGVITNDNGIIIETAPIFKKLKGQLIDNLRKIYKVVEVED